MSLLTLDCGPTQCVGYTHFQSLGGDEMELGMGAREPLVVHAVWDAEAQVWVATSEDVPGLATEASSLDKLIPKLKVMIPELLDANGHVDGDDDVRFKVLGEINEIARREVT